MAYRAVHTKTRRKFAFRYDPETDLIEIVVAGVLDVIDLDDYRPPHRRLKPVQNVDETLPALETA